MTEQARRDCVTAAAGRSASCNELSTCDVFEQQFFDVVEPSLVNCLSEQLNRRLSEILLQLRHVYVVNKKDLLGVHQFGGQKVLPLLFQVAFKSVLQVSASSFTAEVDEGWVNAFIRSHEEVLNDNRFTDTGLSGKKSVIASIGQDAEKVLVFDCVVCGHKDVKEVNGWVVVELRDLLLPGLERVMSSVYTELVYIHVVRQLREVRLYLHL